MNPATGDSKVTFLIHAGYGKTATTFLQQNVFSKLNDVIYLGKDPYLHAGLKTAHENLFRPLYQRNEFTLRARNSSPLIATYGDLILAEIRRQPAKNIVVLSDENIFDYANYNAELNIYLVGRLASYLNEQLQGRLDVKVMATIRNQVSALQSYFAYDYPLLKSRFKSMEEFIAYGLKDTHYASFGGYFYDEVLLELQQQFGADHVKFFVFEQLKEDAGRFIGRILDFLGSKADVGALDLDTYVNRNSAQDGTNYVRDLNFVGRLLGCWTQYYINHSHKMGLIGKGLRSLKGSYLFINERFVRTHAVGNVKLDAELAKMICGIYAESNRHLGDMMALDLRPYGYAYGQDSDAKS